jgi:O-antigen/teichoic acid export membrane protein
VMRVFRLARLLGHRLDSLRHPGGFLGPVLTLVSGTAIAHGITAVTLVIVARLYTPADLGVMGLFASIFYILSVIACLRFDVAIPLPEDDIEARDVLWLALLGGVCLSAVIAIALLLTPVSLLSRAGLEQIAPYLWILPFSLLATALFSALQNWHVRTRSYGTVARARVAQSVGASAIQISSGLVAPSPLGLIAGFVVNGGAAAVLLIVEMWRKAELFRLKPNFSRLKPALVKYRFYPCFSTWEALANSAAIQIPILLIGTLISEDEVGQLLLATSVMYAPMALFGTATSQVFLSQAPERARQGKLYEATLEAIKTLLRLGLPIMAIIAMASPFIFPVMFGDNWARAGIIATWMAPWLLLQFIASPISMVFYITGRQGLALATHIGGLLFRTLATYAGAALFNGKATEAYALSGALFYGTMIFILIYVGRKFVQNTRVD